MKDLLALFAHLLTTLAKLLEPGGAKAIVADSLLIKQQLLIINRSRRRAPKISWLSSIPGRAGFIDVSLHNVRKTFATRLLSRGAAITDVQHLLGHASVKTTEKAYAAFVKNERFKQTIDLLDKPVVPKLTVVR